MLTKAAPGPGEAYGYTVEEVRFNSTGVPLAGLLFLPERTGAMPGIVALGPFGFVKEQAPMGYASRLARDGFAVLIFDPRYHGESGGTPRRLESPSAKIEDVRAALTWLTARPEVDAGRIGVLGICQGASEMIAVAAADDRVRAAALVSGQYLFRENLLGFFGGGGPTLDQRIARGQAALERYRAQASVDYTAVVAAEDKSVALPWPPINDWYHPWTTAKWGEPSRWENRYATMSDAEVWTFDVDAHARKLTKPTLLVHGEHSDGGIVAVKHVQNLIAATDKRLIIVDGVFHTRFYDDPVVVGPCAANVSDWFGTHVT
ncbi:MULTISPECIES: alpha/beta hydrolase [Sphingomonas]|uniref:alpha/beta hydrolase n=1 Tax=Sphingomonas TaxID=13687 RepID=UPI0013B44760|nr:MULTISPECIES: alpha/beta fold hydrolase [Sphingomonas]